METNLRISFQGGEASDALRTLIGDNVSALEKLYGRMVSCHVIVQVPDRHHRTTNLFNVNIHASLPGGIDVNIDQTPQSDVRFADPQFAVSDAFRRAKRLVKERAHKQRGDVKTLHERIERTLDRSDT